MAVYPERRRGRLTGKWVAEVTRNGVRIGRKRFNTKHEGDVWEGHMKLLGTVPLEPEPAPTGPTFGEVAREYLTDRERGRDHSGDLRLSYVSGLLGDRLITEVDERELDKLVRDLRKRPGRGERLTPGTINRYLSAVSSVLKYAKSRKYIPAKPEIPWQTDEGKRLHWLTEEQEKAIYAFLERENAPASALVTRVLVETGMRWGELATLTADQIEPETGWIRLWKTKNRRPRSVPITAELATKLKEAVANAALPNYYTFRKQLTAAAKSAGCADGFSAHALRHTTATRLIQRNVPLPVVKDYLGHRTIEVHPRSPGRASGSA